MSTSFDSDKELAAGALRGEPAQLAAVARRLELVPRLLAAWNRHLEPAVAEEEQVDLACEATISLWQDLPQYTGSGSLDLWLTRRSAQILGLDDDELAPQVLEEAGSIEQAPGQVEARDALAQFRAEQIVAPQGTANAKSKGNQIWAILGVIGVIATFLAISPSSPLHKRSTSKPSLSRPAPRLELRLVEPLGSAEDPKRFEWRAPAGESCTIVIESADGQPWVRAAGITTGVFEPQASPPAGHLRWQVLADSPDSQLSPTPWEVLIRP